MLAKNPPWSTLNNPLRISLGSAGCCMKLPQNSLKVPWQCLKVARLQSEFCTKDFFRATNFLTKNAMLSENFPEMFDPLFCGSEKIPGKFPPNFPLNFRNFPAKNQKKSPTSFCRSAGRTMPGKCFFFYHPTVIGREQSPKIPLRTPICGLTGCEGRACFRNQTRA